MEKRLRLIFNVRKILQWIPVVGIFVGLFSFFDFATKDGRKNFSLHFIERNLLSISPFGFLVLPIADMIASIVRNKQAK